MKVLDIAKQKASTLKVIDIVKSLLPDGTDGTEFWVDRATGTKRPVKINVDRCPIWPPDIFAVIGTIIDRSSCYTKAGPDANDLPKHARYLEEVEAVVREWTSDEDAFFEVPERVEQLWRYVVKTKGHIDITDVDRDPALMDALFLLFAMADEACRGLGWDNKIGTNVFADFALLNFVGTGDSQSEAPELPYRPNSLCALVSPDAAVVMPKTLTATVGCTIRSLSHHLALLPPISQCCPTWALTNEREVDGVYKPIRLLVIPFPFSLPTDSFERGAEPAHLTNGTYTAATFGLKQKWLDQDNGRPITAKMLYRELVLPLLKQANAGKHTPPVTGIVMPECALSQDLADDLADLLGGTSVSFFTTGILTTNPDNGKPRNVAKTYVLHRTDEPLHLEQFKHHRWRLNRAQCDQYGLNFHRLSSAEKWWEEIDVSNRQLPFFALRRYMSMSVLICEDLARESPALPCVRAVGPNLVIALLMDGPQLGQRWPGKYATVLGEDPGSGVLSVTCAAMVDRSNANWKGDKHRIIALWRSEDGSGKEIPLPDGHHAVLLDINSHLVEQHTLDTRSDTYDTRKLSLGKHTPLKLARAPRWL